MNGAGKSGNQGGMVDAAFDRAAREVVSGQTAPSADIPSFHITWRDGAYYVSIPRYDGGEVVRKEDVIALVGYLNAWKAQAKHAESLLAEVSETLLGTRDGGHEQIRAALLAYRNAEETAYYDAQERKEMEEPRAGDE